MIKLHCGCGAKYAFDDRAAGKRAKCKKCGAVFTVKPEAPDEGPIGVAPEMDVFAEAAAAAAAMEKGVRGTVGHLEPGPAGGGAARRVVHAPREGMAAAGASATAYLDGLMRAVLFPTSVNNIILFLIMWFLLGVSGTILAWAGCVGSLAQLIIVGWFCAFRFGIIAAAANGEDDLPAMIGGEGAYEDIFLPLLRWLGSWLLAILPAALYAAIVRPTFGITVGYFPTSFAELIEAAGWQEGGFIAVVLLGFAFWPMLALCLGIGGFASLARLDLMLLTIVRTLPVYLLTAGIVIGVDVVDVLLESAYPAPAVQGGLVKAMGQGFVRTIVLAGANLYGEIVAMKCIGLYYFRFKHRFAWDWE